MRRKGRGWWGHPYSHAVASRGHKLKSKGKTGLILKSLMSLENTVDSAFGRQKIKEMNARAKGKEWIADLDMYNGEIIINDERFSNHDNESTMNWNEHITNDDRHPDPENCVGYIHYHPPSVYETPTAQDYILALSIHQRRNLNNKNKHPPTIFVTTTDDEYKEVRVCPKSENIKEYLTKLSEVQNIDDDQKYFKSLNNIKENMKQNGELIESDWRNLK